MINTTLNDIVFNFRGKKLHNAIRESLQKSAYGLLEIYGLLEVELEKVSTKTNIEGIYSKLVLHHALKNKDYIFDEDYVSKAFSLYQLRVNDDHKNLVYNFITVHEVIVEFREGYIRGLTKGIGPFLIALHSLGAITLPVAFNWPRPRPLKNGMKRMDIGKPFASELIAFIRLLDPQSTDIPDPAFASIGLNQGRRETCSSLGTKLLLATGWHSKEDANVEDLVQIRTAHGSNESEYTGILPYSMIVDIFWRKYGESVKLTPELYHATLRSSGIGIGSLRHLIIKAKLESGLDFGGAASIEALMTRQPSEAHPNVLRSVDALPGLIINFAKLSDNWLTIEEGYINSYRGENKKAKFTAIGWFNVYLFFYLPYWFAENKNTLIEFPDSPSKLLSGVFVTNLVKIDTPVPISFTEMMNELQKKRNWNSNSFYAILKQIEIFFEYIERKSDVFPNCQGFRQPLGPEDYPRTTNKKNTDKRPIERRLFGVTLNLTEALIAYSDVVTQRILEDGLDSRDFQTNLSRFGRVIDTYQVADIIGFVPVLFYRNKTIPLRIIPNCLAFTDSLKLRGFENTVQIPSPHALNQIFVALHTGLRHNHIQWLDARSFDKVAMDDNSEFTQLHVNTDKRKSSAWEPYVNWCVIDRLRAQRRWRNLFDAPGFLVEHSYNDNSTTKWPPIQPLFSFSSSGLPHSDIVYTRVWGLLLATLQGLLTELGESSCLPFKSYGCWVPRLGALEPPGVEYNDPNAIDKRKKAGAKTYYGSNSTGKRTSVPLVFKTPHTPHSTRVTVVQQYLTFLPAEHIGKYITGQTTRTVYYYYHPDAAELKKEGLFQGMSFRNKENQGIDSLVQFNGTGTNTSRPDETNSSLARSLREDLNETLEAFGCLSLSLADSDASGIEVLRTNGLADAVINKTEICPYGNRCPSDVVRLLGGPNKCGLCPYAVRAVDHLPAVSAKAKQMLEKLTEIQNRLTSELEVIPRRFSDNEIEELERKCSDLAAETTGWQLSEEVLYHTAKRICEGSDTRRWVVQKPDIVEKDLCRIKLPDNITAYTLARLKECITFPALESPQIRARFDLMRRQLLAKSGRVNEALSSYIPANPAEECAGLLRSIVESHQLGYNDVVTALESDSHLTAMRVRMTPLLSGGD